MATTTLPASSSTVAESEPPARRRPARPGSSVPAQVARYLALVVAAVLFLLPFYLIVRNALSLDTDITAPGWTLFPPTLHWENISELFSDTSVNIGQSLVNSAVIAVVQTAGQLLLCSMAGYGLARIPYRWATPIFYAILVTLMIPPAVTFIPSFIIVSQLRWVDTLQGIIVPVLFSGFTTFLFRQYFLNFPRSLEEAARVDGLGYVGAFWRVVVPNSGAFFAAIAVITFRQLERVPVAAGDRAGLLDVDGAGRAVDLPDRADHQPARAVPGRGGLDRAAGAGLRRPAALSGAGGGRDRHQGVSRPASSREPVRWRSGAGGLSGCAATGRR